MWKDIPGYENEYQISKEAAIKRKDRIAVDGRHLSARIATASRAMNGKYYISLWKDGKRKTFMLHKLYAKAFCISEKEAIRRIYEGFSGRREPAEYVRGLLEDDIKILKDEQRKGTDRKEEILYMKKFIEDLRSYC